MHITDSYVKKLSAQGFHVTNKLRGEEVPRPVQKFIQQRMLNQRVKLKRSQTPSKREPTNFHITPCHDIKEPQIIHRNRSQPGKSIYYFPINEQTTQIYQSQSRSYIDNLINHSFSTKKQELSQISRTLVSKFTTPKQQYIVTTKELDKDNIASLIHTTKAIQTENDVNHELNFLTAFKMHTNIALDIGKSLKECYQDFKLKLDIKDQKSIIQDLINLKAHKKSNYYLQKQNQVPWLWQSTNKQNKFQIQKVLIIQTRIYNQSSRYQNSEDYPSQKKKLQQGLFIN